MADPNQLFEQGIEEADSLATEAARAAQSIDQMLRLAQGLSDGVEAGAAEAHRRLELLSARLAEGEQDLLNDAGAALGALAGLRSSAAELQSQASRYLTLMHAQLAELRTEKDRVREEVHQQGEAVHDHVARYAEHVKDLEGASRGRMQAVREAIGSFRGVVQASRESMQERRGLALGAMRQLENDGRQRMDYTVQAYDAVAARVQEQVGELQATLKMLTDQVVAGLNRRLRQDTLQSLADAAAPLREAIAGLERFCADSGDASGESLQDLTSQIEDVTVTLERLRHPLDQLRQHLH